MTRKHLLVFLLSVLLASCADGGFDSAGGGGNVGFGGAQDIGQFRDILQEGGIPGPATLDANGFFNEHFTELPPADCGQSLCLHGMVSVNRDWVDDEYQAVLRVALSSSLAPEELSDKPLDLVVVVDTSGSMESDDRLSFVQQGLSLLIDELDEDDRLGIVRYSSEAQVVAELGERTSEELHGIVDGFVAAGGTNIYGGMQLGMEMASEQLSTARQTRVILLSDGLTTAGPSAEEILVLSEGYVSQGIGLTTIGVGNSFNLELMRGLAERGAGNFYYVEDPSAVTEVFTEELDYFVQPLALDLEVRVQSDPSHAIGEVYGTRLWESFGVEGGAMSIPAVFLSSRTSDDPTENGRRGGGSSLFIAMDRLEGAFEGEAMATVQVSYRIPGTEEYVLQEIVVDNPFRAEVPDAGYVSHLEMLQAYATYNVFLGLLRASEEAEADYHCSLATIEQLRESTGRWIQNNPDQDLAADMILLELFADNLVTLGAEAESCGSGASPTYDDDMYAGRAPIACSSGGSAGGLLGSALLLLLMGLLRRRRLC